MAHFAIVKNGKVDNIILIDAAMLVGMSTPPTKQEMANRTFLTNIEGDLIQTDTNGLFRQEYAVIGALYDENEDRFINVFTPNNKLLAPSMGEPCVKGYVYKDGDTYWRCVQSHTRTEHAISIIPALFTKWRFPLEPFVQPTGAHDAYQKNDEVDFLGVNYKSLINNNVWSPSAYPAGWQIIS